MYFVGMEHKLVRVKAPSLSLQNLVNFDWSIAKLLFYVMPFSEVDACG